MLIKLPVPSSVNGAYSNLPKVGRIKTKRYTKWLAEADKWYQLQALHKLDRIDGPRDVHIRLPSVRGDADNYIKLPVDYLVSRGLTGDDRHNVSVSIEIDDEMETKFCWVTVTERTP